MEVIYLTGQKVNMIQPVCSAIGFFDGLHLGHMALVDEVIRIGNDQNYCKALMTFDHYPLYVLGKISEEKYLTSMADRICLLEEKGIDYLFVIAFTKEVASLTPQEFIERYLINTHVHHVVCGFDFRFGCHNAGTAETFMADSRLTVSVIDEVIYQGEKISSTRIREHLESGRIDDLNALLGRHYSVSGKVIRGRRIGHTIGFPTANIDYQSYFLPSGGVYAVQVYIQNQVYIGMCNIGYNPTFTALKKTSLEVYIFDFDQDIYNQNLTVEFYTLIRKEKPFASKEELIHQLKNDEKYIRKYFASLK